MSRAKKHVSIDHDSKAIPLAMASIQSVGKVAEIHGKQQTKRFLNGLGFVVGAEVSVINSLAGDLIVDVKGTRVALNRQMAHRILLS